jgi:hypothetical protein
MDQSRIDKVQKLLHKAERAGTQAEAETYYSKAQELMTKWAIDDAMLAMTEEKPSDEIVTEHVTVKRSSYFKAYTTLIAGIARVNGARSLLYTPNSWGPKAGVDLIGWKTDIERIMMLYTSLVLQLSRERNRQIPEQLRDLGGNDKNVALWRNSFSMGYANTIITRLYEQDRITRAHAVKDDTTGSLLPALRSREDQVKAFMDGIPTKKLKQRTSKYDYGGYNAGREAANRADLGNTRVGQNSRPRIGR